MFYGTFMSTFINFLASNPTGGLIDAILLVIDRGVYRLVSTSFTIFMIMCQLNLNVIYDIASGLIDRVKALIIVFLIFKVGIALLNYLLKPEKAAEGSKKFLINILITAAMLVSCNFVFSVLNELSMMIIGKPANYQYTTMAQIANATNEADQGLIMRLFFGNDNTMASTANAEGIGNNLATKTLCITFPDINSNGVSCEVLKSTLGSPADIKKLDNIIKSLGKSVDGHPAIAMLLGLYIIYSVVKAAIEIGVRMFKLMLLQLLAPLAIITVASEEGTKSKVFGNFTKAYVSIYISAFTRIAAILLVTVLVSKLFNQLDTLVNTATSNSYGIWILVICIVAGYKFAGDIPKMIEEILGKKIGDVGGAGFGKFLSTLVAAPVGAVSGLASGIAAGVGAHSIGGAVVGGLTGFGSGMASGFKGNTIAEKMKAGSEARSGARSRASAIGAAGGVVPWAYGGLMQPFKGGQDAAVERYDREMAPYDAASKIADEYEAAQVASMKDFDLGKIQTNANASAEEKTAWTTAESYLSKFNGYTSAGIKMGEDKDKFAASMLEYNSDYLAAKAQYEANKSDANYAHMIAERDTAITSAKDAYDAVKNIQDNEETRLHAQRFKDATKNLTVNNKKQELALGSKTTPDGKQFTVKDAKKALGSEKARINREKIQYTEKAGYRATHRSGEKK